MRLSALKVSHQISAPYIWAKSEKSPSDHEVQFLYGEPIECLKEEGLEAIVTFPLYSSETFRVSFKDLKECQVFDPDSMVCALWADLREKPHLESKVIGKCPAGSFLKEEEGEKGWIKVQNLGWIHEADRLPLAWEGDYEAEVLRWHFLDFASKFLKTPCITGGKTGRLVTHSDRLGIDPWGVLELSFRLQGKLKIRREKIRSSLKPAFAQSLLRSDLVLIKNEAQEESLLLIRSPEEGLLLSSEGVEWISLFEKWGMTLFEYSQDQTFDIESNHFELFSLSALFLPD